MMKRYHTITVPPAYDGRTLFSYLKKELAFSAAKISSVKYDSGGLLLNGERVTVGAALHTGDRLSVLLTDSENRGNRLIPNEMPLSILYEDEDLIALAKPSGVVCHPSKGHLVDSLASGLRAYFDRTDPEASVHLIGRLDKETSGIVLSAKNAVAAAILMRNDTVRKTYTAAAEGVFGEKKGIITIPMRYVRDEAGILRVEAGEEKSRESEAQASESRDEKTAVTEYQVLSQREDYAVLLVRIPTGRMHQIRFHMAETGHPLLGDRVYGGPTDRIGRAALHAGELSFRHPFTGEEIHLAAAPPEDLKELLKQGEETGQT